MTQEEGNALYGAFLDLYDAVYMKHADPVIQHEVVKVAGVITFLKRAGKIMDDEDLTTLINEIKTMRDRKLKKRGGA